MPKKSLFLFMLPLLASAQPVNGGSSAEHVCTDPRPQVCTMDYRPVCGRRVSGERKTFSNGCTACSHPEVESYTEGKCETKEH
jgi:hypothetical protein